MASKKSKKEIDKEIAFKRSILLAVVIFSGWLFFWPLVECWYEQSLDPLLGNETKLISFILGGIVFWISDYYMFKKNGTNIYRL